MEKMLKENELSSGVRILDEELIALCIDQEALWQQESLDTAYLIYQRNEWFEKLMYCMIDEAVNQGWPQPTEEDIEFTMCVPDPSKMLIWVKKIREK